MSSRRISTLSQAWYRWKALRLPWRRRFLVGFDLAGNTYWEFRPRGVERLRRIVHHPRSTHYSDVKVTPLWHQWLRYTREHPPSIEEQRNEVTRQARMKYLAAEADARWEAKPRLTDAPGAAIGQRAPALGSVEHKGEASKEPVADKGTNAAAAQDKADAADPWARARAQGPGEKWQPTAWDPTAPKKS
ncbi:NADH ubiquinone oxidoreductase subunit NDUFA12 domain-containing protein [Sarocladium implicatum]|nr:NADH ubiquinone oxidoreductase subunit NDUFA12 domain-containing protein [Sarocladium implicatum]